MRPKTPLSRAWSVATPFSPLSTCRRLLRSRSRKQPSSNSRPLLPRPRLLPPALSSATPTPAPAPGKPPGSLRLPRLLPQLLGSCPSRPNPNPTRTQAPPRSPPSPLPSSSGSFLLSSTQATDAHHLCCLSSSSSSPPVFPCSSSTARAGPPASCGGPSSGPPPPRCTSCPPTTTNFLRLRRLRSLRLAPIRVLGPPGRLLNNSLPRQIRCPTLTFPPQRTPACRLRRPSCL